MSLYPDDSHRQDRSRSRSREPTYAYPEDDLDGRYSSRRGYPEDGIPTSSRPGRREASPAADPYRSSLQDRVGDDRFKFLPQKYSSNLVPESPNRDRSRSRSGRDGERDKGYDEDLAYGKPPGPAPEGSKHRATASLSAIAAVASAAGLSYLSGGGRDKDKDGNRIADEPRRPRADSYLDPRMSGPAILTTVDPSDRDRDRSRDPRRDASPGRPRAGTLTVDYPSRDRSRSRSPQPPTGRMSNLSVSTGRPSNLSIGNAPPSPMLDAYRGTWQSCSPMPSPMLQAVQHPRADPAYMNMGAPHSPSVPPSPSIPLSPIGSDFDSGSKFSRRARFHDSEDTASRLANALKGNSQPDTAPLIEILPSLSHDQVMTLREDYKAIVKTGSERKGVNIAKHIRARLKDEDPLLMKACYAVALGKWESESYWANFWYHGDKTRRELLIESLMGRSNAEIAAIKDGFTDKKYDNSLTKCMKTELKEDKFKKAVLMVLEERRMEDFDSSGRKLPIDFKLVDQDVDDLYRAIKSDKGGETTMITIVIQRSDSHLREVLKDYERIYRNNFARDALKKSGNLVGEVLAHILNGIINKPVRDALLLHHAITASRKDDLRRELLISRLVRCHWDAYHMQDVKVAYKERYGKPLQDAVREVTSGEWGMFCSELCIARMPNEVRRFTKQT